MDSFQDDPQYKGMKYLVFGTILSSLLLELLAVSCPACSRIACQTPRPCRCSRSRACLALRPLLFPEPVAPRSVPPRLACQLSCPGPDSRWLSIVAHSGIPADDRSLRFPF